MNKQRIIGDILVATTLLFFEAVWLLTICLSGGTSVAQLFGVLSPLAMWVCYKMDTDKRWLVKVMRSYRKLRNKLAK